jgi:nicotinate-nucleotide adenylyltransferase
VANHLGLDRLLWIPAGDPPHKSGSVVSPAAVRLEMVREAARADGRFEVSTAELDRPGPSYTVDTVRALRADMPEPELFLILGADQFRAFAEWRDPQEIVRHATLAVMDREGESARALRGEIPGGGEAIFVPVSRVDVSSTLVRATVADEGDIGSLVPAGVAAIIERAGLYSSDMDPAA